MLKRERPVLITWQRVAARLVADWRSAVGDGGICHWRQDNPLPRKARVKIEGRREQEFFEKQSATWRREQDGLLLKIQEIQNATPAPIDQAVDMLKLTSQTSELFLAQPASEQRRFLQTVVEKAAWQDSALRTTLFEPFEILRHSNQESNRKEKEIAGSGRDSGIWLPI